MIRLWIEWFRVTLSTSGACEALKRIAIDLVLLAEIQAAAVAAVWPLSSANVSKPAINYFLAIRMIAPSWHTVANVPLPLFVVAD